MASALLLYDDQEPQPNEEARGERIGAAIHAVAQDVEVVVVSSLDGLKESVYDSTDFDLTLVHGRAEGIEDLRAANRTLDRAFIMFSGEAHTPVDYDPSSLECSCGAEHLLRYGGLFVRDWLTHGLHPNFSLLTGSTESLAYAVLSDLQAAAWRGESADIDLRSLYNPKNQAWDDLREVVDSRGASQQRDWVVAQRLYEQLHSPDAGAWCKDGFLQRLGLLRCRLERLDQALRTATHDASS